MATVGEIAKASFQKILTQGSEAPFEADEYNDFITALNVYMLDLDASGISLGYTEVSSLGDAVTIPTGALRGVIYNMALEIAPDYGGVVTADLVRIAREGKRTMSRLGQITPTSSFPGTLPVGSGNQWDGGGTYTRRFYPDAEAAILAETTGSIGLETGTEEAS